MKALCLVAIFLCAACKKPAPKAPSNPEPTPEAQPATDDAAKKPAAAPVPPKSGDPCSGGEVH